MTAPGGVSSGDAAASASRRMTPVRDGSAPRPRSTGTLLALGALALLAFAGFAALGVWQVERRAWKLDLIERVEARLKAPPAAAPGLADWRWITTDQDEYRRVRLTGVFDHEHETLVQAVTELGAGYWVLTPLETTNFTVLVNRGFVPAERRNPRSRDAGLTANKTSVTGLLRISEPKGGFLRANDPAADQWYSRDVAAIAANRHLSGDVAPYFIDADATKNASGWPVGGLTVIAFRNSHLVYAITWFALAAMVAGGFAIVFAHERRARRATRA